MKIKKYVILFMMIILFVINSHNEYALIVLIDLNTINIQNVSTQSNTYILLKNDDSYYEEDALNDLIKRIDKNILYIEKKFNNNKLPKELENTNQTITIDGNDYIKIKVLKDVTIAWNEKDFKNNKDIDMTKDILIANIVNNQINVIDTTNIKSIDYFDNSPEGYGGNSVRRKAMVYDASNNKLYDITERTVNEEKEKLNIIAERNNGKKEILEKIMIPIAAIALYLVLPSIIVGLIVDAIAKKYKKKERKK